MVGRSTADAELERDLGTKPFETYELYRGQKFGGRGTADGEGSDYREVGKFKVCGCGCGCSYLCKYLVWCVLVRVCASCVGVRVDVYA